MVGEYDERENKRKTIIKTKEDNILELNTELEAYKKGYEDYFAELQVAKKNLENTTH